MCKYSLQRLFIQKACRFPEGKENVASLEQRGCGLGIPIHIEMQSEACNIEWYTLLVSNRALYVYYIALAINPFLGSASMRSPQT